MCRRCESNEPEERHYDARGIYLGFACIHCEKEFLKQFRRDVLTDPNYECDEDIEPDDGVISAEEMLEIYNEPEEYDDGTL